MNIFPYNCNISREENLNVLAKAIVERYTDDVHTWDLAIERIQFLDYTIEYNRITLCINSCSLPDKDFRLLLNNMAGLINLRVSGKGAFRDRREYISLFKYYLLNKEIQDCSFYKQEPPAPDFVLKRGSITLGIEVTSFTSQHNELCKRIYRECIGTDMIKSELKDFAHSNHKSTKDFTFIDLNGKVAIMPPPYNITKEIKGYLELLNKKYQKYRDAFSDYDSFTLLCDATEGIELSLVDDIDSLKQDIRDFSINWSLGRAELKVAILYLLSGETRPRLQEILLS